MSVIVKSVVWVAEEITQFFGPSKNKANFTINQWHSKSSPKIAKEL